VVTGRGLVESPRWHDNRFWFADWTAGEILSIDEHGGCQVMARAAAPPLSFDFAPDGALLVVSSAAGQLLKRSGDGKLRVFAELGQAGSNEIVVDAKGNIYVNGPSLLLITPDGRVSREADGFAFPNGMAILPDGKTLVVAESHARCLTAFDIGADGHLSRRRVWADVEGPPDGICADGTGAIWYADVPHAYCRRVKEGGEVLDEISIDRGAFACMLGGPSRRTLLIAGAKWFGMDRMGEMAGTGRLYAANVEVSGAGWP
jgi:sugar lactone lactonase YvrE